MSRPIEPRRGFLTRPIRTSLSSLARAVQRLGTATPSGGDERAREAFHVVEQVEALD